MALNRLSRIWLRCHHKINHHQTYEPDPRLTLLQQSPSTPHTPKYPSNIKLVGEQRLVTIHVTYDQNCPFRIFCSVRAGRAGRADKPVQPPSILRHLQTVNPYNRPNMLKKLWAEPAGAGQADRVSRPPGRMDNPAPDTHLQNRLYTS